MSPYDARATGATNNGTGYKPLEGRNSDCGQRTVQG
jgi:hypothetical protein